MTENSRTLSPSLQQQSARKKRAVPARSVQHAFFTKISSQIKGHNISRRSHASKLSSFITIWNQEQGGGDVGQLLGEISAAERDGVASFIRLCQKIRTSQIIPEVVIFSVIAETIGEEVVARSGHLYRSEYLPKIEALEQKYGLTKPIAYDIYGHLGLKEMNRKFIQLSGGEVDASPLRPSAPKELLEAHWEWDDKDEALGNSIYKEFGEDGMAKWYCGEFLNGGENLDTLIDIGRIIIDMALAEGISEEVLSKIEYYDAFDFSILEKAAPRNTRRMENESRIYHDQEEYERLVKLWHDLEMLDGLEKDMNKLRKKVKWTDYQAVVETFEKPLYKHLPRLLDLQDPNRCTVEFEGYLERFCLACTRTRNHAKAIAILEQYYRDVPEDKRVRSYSEKLGKYLERCRKRVGGGEGDTV